MRNAIHYAGQQQQLPLSAEILDFVEEGSDNLSVGPMLEQVQYNPQIFEHLALDQ